jgi:hypothetical protein
MLDYSFSTFIPTAIVIATAMIFLYIAGSSLFGR